MHGADAGAGPTATLGRRGPVNLLDLPLELLDQVVRWVALLRYEYSESRRPRPSALHHLAYGTNRLLRQLALPYLFRQRDSDLWHQAASTTAMRRVWLPEEGLVEVGSLVRVHRHGWTVLSEHAPPLVEYLPRLVPNLERLVLHPHGVTAATYAEAGTMPSLKYLELRHGTSLDLHPAGIPCAEAFPNLVSAKLHLCDPGMVATLSHNVHLVNLSLTVEMATVLDMSVPLWARLRRLEITVLPQRREPELVDLVPFLRNFIYPADNKLRSLTLSVQSDPRHASQPQPMHATLHAVEASFRAIPLTTLELDVFATCRSADLTSLARMYPTLHELSLSDRTIWEGSRSDLVAALSPLTSLVTLSCRLFPVTPRSRFDQHVTSDPASDENGDEEQFASSPAIALEAASYLPRLALAGFIGQHSSTEWFRVRRDAEGEPEMAEGVTLVDTDLDRL